VADLIFKYKLPREAVPTEWLKEPLVWLALLEDMPMTALIRNLATLTRIGVITNGSEWTKRIIEMITDAKKLKAARIHPIAALSAMLTYASGHGERGKNVWTPIPAVVDALDAAFYASFDTLEPLSNRWLLALDVSGSMDMGQIAGVQGLTPRVASAAMAMATAKTAPNYQTIGFTADTEKNIGRNRLWQRSSAIVELSISPRQRLDDIIKSVRDIPFGATDCALPMIWAMQKKVEVDTFVIYTDNETWHGDIHPAQALREYRQKMGINAKLIVVAMLANKFSIADPDDAGMLDVVGFDTATPQLIADFGG
jgi:60 kDa SS-A/Ro ribonucleoprotein